MAMIRSIPILFFLFTATICSAQFIVKGTVFSKEEGALPGVSIVEPGTENQTTSNLDGNFRLTVTNPNATLVFSFVGFIPKQVDLNGEDSISINLKPDCNRDFFNSQSIHIYALSGILNNPVGGQLDFAFTNFSRGTLITGFAYQSSLESDHFINGKLEYKHFIFNCDLDFDLNWYHRRVNFSDFKSSTNSFETNFNYENWRLTAGYSVLNFENKVSDTNQKFSAPVVGLGAWIHTVPVRTLLTTKAAFYNDRTEIISQATFFTKYFELFVNYYKLDSFSELTIGIGKEFGYWLKSQKKYRPQRD